MHLGNREDRSLSYFQEMGEEEEGQFSDNEGRSIFVPDSTNLPTPHPLSNFPMMMNYFIKLWSILIAINFDFSIQSSRCLQQEKQDVQISCPFQRAAKS